MIEAPTVAWRWLVLTKHRRGEQRVPGDVLSAEARAVNPIIEFASVLEGPPQLPIPFSPKFEVYDSVAILGI